MKKSEIIKTITIIIAFIWHCLMALLTPIWMGILYMFFTGHGKGYDYDLQSEADIYILLALIGVIIWMISTIPVFVKLMKHFRKINKNYWWLPIGIFLFLGMITILLMGWDNYFMMTWW